MDISKENAIKAYKVFNKDWSCKGFQYEVGKEYQHKGKIQICESGFHSCEKLSDCFNYYPFQPSEIKVAEVLAWGDVKHEESSSKICSSRIEITKELEWAEVLKICNSGYGNSGYGNSGYGNSGNGNSGNWNSGYGNSGNGNSGNRNSGYGNSGNGNSGDRNSGDRNSGDRNSGNGNSGDRNSGDGNSGDRNSGNGNSGDWNSGNGNSGNWNSGDRNSGYFNTPDQKYIFIFNKRIEKSILNDIRFPYFLYFELSEWVNINQMSSEEKNKHPECDAIGGYLKTYSYKEAFRKSFEMAKRKPDWQKQLALLKAIPNFDAKIFEEISGIREEELV